MLSVYYKIWVDAILFARSSKAESQNWKIFTIIPISILQGINLVTILLWIRVFSHRKFTVILPVSVFQLKPANTMISIIFTFFLPFLLLNYLLVFTNERYNELLKTYKGHKGRWYLWYIALTLGIFAGPYLLKIIF